MMIVSDHDDKCQSIATLPCVIMFSLQEPIEMKNPRAFLLLFLLASTVVFSSNSNGVAHQQNKDRTGAPGSDNTCQQCHSGGSFGTLVNAFLVADGDMALSDTYFPGAAHSLVVTVSGSGSPSGYGVHGTAVFDDGSNAGTFSDQDANDCIWLDEVNGRHIFEQNDLCSSGTFEVVWEAPEAGSGPVTVYVAAIAANGNGTASGDSFGGASFTFNEANLNSIDGESAQGGVEVEVRSGTLGLTHSTGHTTTVLSVDGRILHQGFFEAGSHVLQLNGSGLMVVHSLSTDGVSNTHKIWIP
jgi:hypothetical protein